MNEILNFVGILSYFGQQNMLQGETFPFQTSMIGQKFGMHNFFFTMIMYIRYAFFQLVTFKFLVKFTLQI